MTSIADAHISVVSGPATTNTTQKITFGSGHGCTFGDEHLDTLSVKIEIPAGVTSVRPLPSNFGKVSVEKTGENVTAVIWDKAESAATVSGDDISYYELTLRARVDAAAFSTVSFRITQTCKAADGTPVVVFWEGDDAASLVVTPVHGPGWNKLKIPEGTTVALGDLPKYLGNALIVWRGTAAYSSSADTMAMIAATPGVTALAGDLQANDEIWVRY